MHSSLNWQTLLGYTASRHAFCDIILQIHRSDNLKFIYHYLIYLRIYFGLLSRVKSNKFRVHFCGKGVAEGSSEYEAISIGLIST
jgi:hypothetical protein